jgi:hypothetical protein
VGAGRWEAGAGELGGDAADEGAPAGGGVDVIECEVVLLAEIERAGVDVRDAAFVAVDAAATVETRAAGDAVGDGEGQGEPLVVVGVLADEVDATGGEGAAVASGHGRWPRAGWRRTPRAGRRR